ncbi:MAG: YhbY family RNA-binding protein [Methylophilales bacterium]|jgi:RNA-binding protein|nr:YhbY family RNA-binding protein [Pseudomonadota bacterium]NQW34721.1 YhbY family RNA-binding protein [Methylophilales bacterium]|tara:strand:- start:26084 stop:26371 length:288 start_codon:yes stop_codon:yes gene_type:complete
MLNSKQIAHLKALSHTKSPVVQIGNKGLSESVLKEIELNLKAHELIKIQVQDNDKAKRSITLVSICEKVGAEAVNHIGKQIVIFRANDKTKIVLP